MFTDEGGQVTHLSLLLGVAARRWGSDVAVEEESGAAITYRDLYSLVCRIRYRLHDLGVRPGDRVGLCLPKSIDAVAAIHAILAAGASYVPVDPDGPAERASIILSDCTVGLLLVSAQRSAELTAALAKTGYEPPTWILPAVGGGSGFADLADAAAIDAHTDSYSPDDLAYILYTSGSTGRPKGVMLSHTNAISFVDWCSTEFMPTVTDRFSSHAPLHFDLSILDLFVPVKHGARIVLITPGTGKDPLALAALISARGITVWYSAPSILALMSQYGRMQHDYSALRLVLFAGEVFPVKHMRALRALLPGPAFHNLYGPTETNVCTAYQIPHDIPADRQSPYPIGVVLPDLRGRVVDSDGRDARAGEEGELWISGPGVMQGYWNRPEQNAQVFVTDGTGARWYRTGDIVTEDSMGVLTYVGRRDRMVKRRGYRIELGEVEAALYRHDSIEEVAVVASTDADRGTVITAFLVFSGEPLSTLQLKKFSTEVLPAAMVPDRFVVAATLPRTSTDKIDYQRLAAQI